VFGTQDRDHRIQLFQRLLPKFLIVSSSLEYRCEYNSQNNQRSLADAAANSASANWKQWWNTESFGQSEPRKRQI